MTVSASTILETAIRLGSHLRRITAVEWVGPCPKCGGHDRFGVNVNRGVFNCRGCDVGGDQIELVRHVLSCSFREALEFVGDDRSTRRAAAAIPSSRQALVVSKRVAEIVSGIVAELSPLRGTPGEVYLRQVRLIDTGAISDVLNSVDAIGWHSSVYFNEPGHQHHGQRLGCVVGVMTDVVTARPTGAISRTYISPNGAKVGKAKTLGAPGGIVRLTADEDVTAGLFLAEGLETALATMSIGLRPLWSTGSTALMASFPLLAGIECITIVADHDENGAGLKAANRCACAWGEAGKETRVLMSRSLGDLNDCLRGAA